MQSYCYCIILFLYIQILMRNINNIIYIFKNMEKNKKSSYKMIVLYELFSYLLS